MANHKSSIKRIRQTENANCTIGILQKTARNAVRKMRSTTDKAVASEMLPKISAMLDKLAKRNIIHKNKASNLKSKLTVYVNKLAIANSNKYKPFSFWNRAFCHEQDSTKNTALSQKLCYSFG